MMDEKESNSIRDTIYKKLDQLTEKKIQEQFLQGNGPQIITEIICDCKDDVLALPPSSSPSRERNDDEQIGVMATVLMHYLCTNLLVPTQRKIMLYHNDKNITNHQIHIDMVIPDAKTLKTNPNSSLVLCILTSTKPTDIQKRITEIKNIQPNQENIWLISPKPIDSTYKTFVVISDNNKDNSFANIIYDINAFLEKNGQLTTTASKFKIFKTV